MTQHEIQEVRDAIKKEIRRLNGMLNIEKAKLENLQKECEHPNMHPYSACGDMGRHCPDCGYTD